MVLEKRSALVGGSCSISVASSWIALSAANLIMSSMVERKEAIRVGADKCWLGGTSTVHWSIVRKGMPSAVNSHAIPMEEGERPMWLIQAHCMACDPEMTNANGASIARGDTLSSSNVAKPSRFIQIYLSHLPRHLSCSISIFPIHAEEYWGTRKYFIRLNGASSFQILMPRSHLYAYFPFKNYALIGMRFQDFELIRGIRSIAQCLFCLVFFRIIKSSSFGNICHELSNKMRKRIAQFHNLSPN